MIKTSHIIKSSSYHNDGRLQKWIYSLKSHEIDSDVFFLEDKNEKGIRIVNGIEIKTISLFFRKYFKKRKGYFFKIPEYSFKTIRYLNNCNSDILIFHDVQQYLNLLIALSLSISKNKTIVWDLHELPHTAFLKNSLTRNFLRYILEHVDIVVYTNEERRQYIFERLRMKEKKYFILNNYPNDEYLKQPPRALPEELINLRSGLPYILWLGGALKGRNFTSFFESYKKVSNAYNLVILGRIEALYQEEIKSFENKKAIYNSFVKQEEMIDYIDNAFFSVVLYKSTTPNNYYCEPNRLYQLVTRGIPSIVGNNPTMKAIIEKYNGGIVLSDDGTNVSSMDIAFNTITNVEKRHKILENLKNPSIKIELNWNSQFIKLIKELKS